MGEKWDRQFCVYGWPVTTEMIRKAVLPLHSVSFTLSQLKENLRPQMKGTDMNTYWHSLGQHVERAADTLIRRLKREGLAKLTDGRWYVTLPAEDEQIKDMERMKIPVTYEV